LRDTVSDAATGLSRPQSVDVKWDHKKDAK
jgi:hypothetical protein